MPNYPPVVIDRHIGRKVGSNVLCFESTKCSKRVTLKNHHVTFPDVVKRN